MLMDSGASDHLIGDELIPRQRDSLRVHENLKEPKAIVTACNEKVYGAATGTT